jgi:hypothetical protein
MVANFAKFCIQLAKGDFSVLSRYFQKTCFQQSIWFLTPYALKSRMKSLGLTEAHEF